MVVSVLNSPIYHPLDAHVLKNSRALYVEPVNTHKCIFFKNTLNYILLDLRLDLLWLNEK